MTTPQYPSLQLPGSFPIPSVAPVYVDGIPVADVAPASTPRVPAGQGFWSSQPRPAGDPSAEQLIISLARSRTINYVSLDVAHFPSVLTLSWWDGSEWQPALFPGGAAFEIITTGSVPGVVDNPAALLAGLNPWHYGAGHWVHHDERIAPVQTTRLMISIVRPAPSSGFQSFPVNPSGVQVPYPVGIRGLDFGLRIETAEDAPPALRDPSVLSMRQPFTTTTDANGSPVLVSLRQNRASDLLRGGTWRSDAQPHADSVVSLYLDGRDASGNPQLIDRFYIEPVTSGVRMNVYYSPDPPAPQSFTALDDPLLPSLIASGGAQMPQAGSSGIVFPDGPGWVTVANQGAGTAADSPWWTAIEIRPAFSSSDPGSYVLADSGLIHLAYVGGELVISLPPAGYAILASFQIPFQAGDSIVLAAGFDGDSFFAWNPAGGLVQVPAVLPVPPAASFRFGGSLPGTYAARISSLGPYAWWPLDDASGSSAALDASGYLHPAAATGVSFGVQGSPSGATAALFSGDSSLLTSYGPVLDQITVQAWINLAGLPQIAGARIAATADMSAADVSGFDLWLGPGRTLMAGIGNGTSRAILTGPQIPDSGWTLVSLTWDGTTVRLYTGSTLADSAPLAGPMAAGSSPVGIGVNPVSSSGYFSGNIADVAIFPAALSAYDLGSALAASSQAAGNCILRSWILKQQQLDFSSGIPADLSAFAADPGVYVVPADPGADSTSGAVARFAPEYVLGETCPWGFVGGLGSAYESLTWIPVQRDYRLARGFVEFDPVLASAWKLEFTALRPEPVEYFTDRAVPATFFPPFVQPSRAEKDPSAPAVLDPGLVVNQSAASSAGFSDMPYRPDPPPQGTPLPTEALYASDPGAAGRMSLQGGGLYNFRTWQPPAVVPRWSVASPHNYRSDEVARTSRIGYFVALSGIAMYRLDYTTADDTSQYTDIFADPSNVEPSSLAPGGWTWVPGSGLVLPGNATTPAQAESVVFNSAHQVTGLQFATVQSDPVQLLADPDFTDPGFAGWEPVGDAAPLTAAPVNAQLGQMVSVQRLGGRAGLDVPGGAGSWGSLETAYASWAALMQAFPAWIDFGQVPATQAMGGIGYSAAVPQTSPGGRVYAAARVFSPVALSAPLYLQLLDGATGSVIAEAEQEVAGGSVTEWYAGFTLGSAQSSSNTWAQEMTAYPSWADIAAAAPLWSQMDTSVQPLGRTIGVRLVQKLLTSDTWDVDNISVFEDSVLWEFSRDGGTTWYAAFDIRNNPRGALTFPEGSSSPPVLGPIPWLQHAAIGTQLRWRVTAFRPGITISALTVRPWYVIAPRGITPRPAFAGAGPNIAPNDQYGPVDKDARWQVGQGPIPQSWYFRVRQMLSLAGSPSDFPGGPPPPSNAVLGDALVYEGVIAPVPETPTYSDIYSDTYIDTYGLPDGGDLYTDTYSDLYGLPASVITGTEYSGTAALSAAASLQAAPSVIPLPPSALGADLGDVTSSPGIAVLPSWIEATGIPLPVRRVPMGNQIPASLAASPVAGDAGFRRVLLDFRPDATTTPQQLADFLSSCQAGGLEASVSIWAGAETIFASPADFFAILTAYVPAIRLAGYPVVLTLGNDSIVHNALSQWYPGDNVIDVIAPTFWCTGAAPGSGGDTLAVAGSFAAAHGKPLGLAGFGTDRSRYTTAQAEDFLAYVARFFAARRPAAENSDLIYLGTGSYSLIGAPASLIAAYDALAASL